MSRKFKTSQQAPTQTERTVDANDRPAWDNVWMRVAIILSERSIDTRTKVGCLIVSADNTQILSVGYNGLQRGGPNEVESLEPGQSGCLHAEDNAIIKMDFNFPKKRIMYTTVSPCAMCAKRIINANIDEVVYLIEYRDTTGIDILRRANINVRQTSV